MASEREELLAAVEAAIEQADHWQDRHGPEPPPVVGWPREWLSRLRRFLIAHADCVPGLAAAVRETAKYAEGMAEADCEAKGEITCPVIVAAREALALLEPEETP